MLGRVFFAALFLSAVLLYRRQGIKLDRRSDYFYMAGIGLLLAIHWISFFKSIQVSTVAVGLLTFSTFPVFTTFLEPYFFNEKLRTRNITIALIALAGVSLVVPEFEIGNNITQGALYGITAGLTFAVLSILNRKFVKNYSSLVVAFYQDSFAALFLLPFLFLQETVSQPQDVFLLVLLGVIFTGVAHSLFIRGLAKTRAQTASIIASLEPVYGIVAAVLLLGEIPEFRVVLGGAVILGAACYATFNSM